MKKLFTTLALTAVCVGALAQGKVQFVNDAAHEYYFGSNVLPADAALANQKTPIVALPSGKTLVADLYAGTSSGSLVLYSTTTLSTSSPGRQNTLGVTLSSPAIAGGAAAFFQVQIRDNAFATAALSAQGFSYYGFSSIFTVQPSSTIAFNSIVNHGGTALSTWADAPSGAISINVVPEPSSMALAGIGAASLLIFRRKK
jgi:PEP-CTERM motif